MGARARDRSLVLRSTRSQDRRDRPGGAIEMRHYQGMDMYNEWKGTGKGGPGGAIGVAHWPCARCPWNILMRTTGSPGKHEKRLRERARFLKNGKLCGLHSAPLELTNGA